MLYREGVNIPELKPHYNHIYCVIKTRNTNIVYCVSIHRDTNC